jgi:hypothetical protein
MTPMTPTPPSPPPTGPTPCNSLLLSADGSSSQPANCLDFCLLSEAMFVQQLMQSEGVIPQGAIVNIADDPSSVAATRIVYGDDGRRVYVITWDEEFQGGIVNFQQNAGMAVVQIKAYPAGHGDWKKNMEAADVERVGRQKDPSNPDPVPGITYTS